MPKAKSRRSNARKEDTLQIRLQPAQKSLIECAAEARKTTISRFVLDNACVAAEHVLADQNQFVLPPDKWREFCDALEAPSRDLPALRKLLTEPSVFDDAARPTDR